MSVASCASTQATKVAGAKPRSKEYFSEKEYGVKASPRVVQEGQAVPKGGGRYMVGNPYEVKGKTYFPKEDPSYNKNGLASWYGSAFHGRVTANGEVYDSAHLSAASPTFPLPSYARVPISIQALPSSSASMTADLIIRAESSISPARPQSFSTSSVPALPTSTSNMSVVPAWMVTTCHT